MASIMAICSSPPEAILKSKRSYQPVGLCVTDVPFYGNFFPSGVHPLVVDVVHPKPGFSRWVCKDFKSGSFLQPAALQVVFNGIQSWLAVEDLKGTSNLSGDKIHLIVLISFRRRHTLLSVLIDLE